MPSAACDCSWLIDIKAKIRARCSGSVNHNALALIISVNPNALALIITVNPNALACVFSLNPNALVLLSNG